MASYGHPRPHINGFLWASKSAVSSCSQQPPRATHQWLLMATLAANRHPRATHQWLLMGVQVCRLPALKPSKPFCQPCSSQQAPQGDTSMASYGRPSLPFARPKTLQTLQTLKTLQTLQATSIASAVCQP